LKYCFVPLLEGGQLSFGNYDKPSVTVFILVMMSTIKLLCVIEATTVTGPAKNLLNFFRLLDSPEFRDQSPRVEPSIVTFHRKSGGVERHDHQTAEPEFTPNSFVAAARGQGVEVDIISERFRFDPRAIQELRRIVARRAPDIVQTHMVKSHFLTKLSGLGRKYPWVAYHHGYTATDLKMRGYNQLNRWSLPSAARVITVCGPFVEDLSQAGVRRDHIVVCHNSVAAPQVVSEDSKRMLRERLGIVNGERVVLTVGRLSREKGHRDLVNALSLLRELNSELKFKLVIVGNGPEREHLERAAREKGLDANVLFVGHVEDVAPYYAIADALALPSHSEGSPNVLLEAMAAGLPVIATAVGGVPEIAIKEESALLVPAHNPQLFAGALHRVLTGPELAQMLRAKARERVATQFSPESAAQSLIRTYRELMSATAELAQPQVVSI
jgi:glycosyltransferase involved in cell wall biosynthesis